MTVRNASPEERPRVSVIVPARNEEANIARCLRSILRQHGIGFELIVVDDHSTDRTLAVADELAAEIEFASASGPVNLRRMLVTQARPLPDDWTGKSNALWTGVQQATGDWLLFTDADTEHAPGSLAAAVAEAERDDLDLLSLSPEQEVSGFCERALMPVVFAELASTYRPQDIGDRSKAIAAANGQYLLIRRQVYEQLGGHAAVAGDLLEDVALATRVKSAGYSIRLRLGKGMVRTRMYRGWHQMSEGWTKNLALLFPSARRLAHTRQAEFGFLTLPLLGAAVALAAGRQRTAALALVPAAVAWTTFLRRIGKAHFDPLSTMLAVFGLPLFANLLLLSEAAHQRGSVEWKGRNYSPAPASAKEDEGLPAEPAGNPVR